LKILGELQESQEIRDRAAIFAGPQANLLRAQLKFISQPGKGVGCFDRIEIFPLDVFDQGDFQQTVVWYIADYDR
jgi:hypothetical protein